MVYRKASSWNKRNVKIRISNYSKSWRKTRRVRKFQKHAIFSLKNDKNEKKKFSVVKKWKWKKHEKVLSIKWKKKL